MIQAAGTQATEHSGRTRWLASYLSVVQFFLLASWTVYAIYLPELLVQVGLEKSMAPWILLADQVLFAIFDIAAGFAADRAFRAYARIGPWILAATVVSSLAFLLLPWVPVALEASSTWRGPLLIGLAALWVISSAALRAPVFGMLSRHAAQSDVPGLAGLALAGMGLAAAISPYLGMTLKGVAPQLPFAISSLALMMAAVGLIFAERRFLPPHTEKTLPLEPSSGPGPMLFLMMLFLAAAAFQIGVNLNAAPRYLRDFLPPQLPWVLPVFWIGFSFTVFAAGKLCEPKGPAIVFAMGCLTGASGLLLTAVPGPGMAIAGYLIAGVGWGAAMAAGFGLAAETGRPHRVATMTGLLFAVLAVANFGRIGANLLGWPTRPDISPWLGVVPYVGWGAAGLLMFAVWWRTTQRRI